jgi:flagellar biosynthesis protein FlhF
MAGLFRDPDFEIAATSAPPAAALLSARSKGPFASDVYRKEERPEQANPLTTLRSELRAEIRAVKIAAGGAATTPSTLVAEVSRMREALEQLAPLAEFARTRSAYLLRDSGIEGAAAAALTRSLRARANGPGSEQERFRSAVAELITVAPTPLETRGRSIIAVVGPTGVGKTTTLAKLATQARMDGKSVTLVSCDTFRVGGVEHLKRYAGLLDVPWAVARTAAQLADLLARAATELVIVDTAGREPDSEAAERLLSAASFAAAPQCHGFTRHVLLCVPAVLRAIDTARIKESFCATDPTGIVVTKIDETDHPSGLVHATFATKLPVALLCAGQRVPADMAPATVDAILDAVTGKPTWQPVGNVVRQVAA